ncbi:hypothetical protein SAMN03159341_102397 [Paenibacillus sp. 1_12]|uniref:hypothetical protein n=1 Tax=Paenibacillus sp. 1_12 TaxID=1566278 RepID=UPI0008DFA60B|nr:hypothetical protein [Paenibacillus sp. 1_12]SFK96049.1 hypothetical protein SAMN03159341_102397 [Paenibacillus sp. 1_12]
MTLTSIVVIVLLVIVVVVISNATIRKSNQENFSSRDRHKRQKPTAPRRKVQSTQAASYEDTPVPSLLGIQPTMPMKQAVLRLEKALTAEFTAKLKTRILNKQPQMSPAEFEWKFLELKRYFLMTAILKDVPMFSDAVDDIWHEMLMFTREYSQLGEAFLGSPIHHAPHIDGVPDPDGRAWFDWIYAHMFIHTAYSSRIWGPFFRYPLNPERLEELRQAEGAAIRSGRFNQQASDRYPEIHETINKLIHQAKEQVSKAIPGTTYSAERPASQSAAYMPFLAGALLFYSATQLDSFDSLMEQHYTQEELIKREQDTTGYGGASSCSGSDSGSLNHESNCSNDSGGGHDSGSSSSSSCSSCGGGGD